MKRIFALALAVVLLFPANASAMTDDYILNDTVNVVYGGRADAANIISNLNFTDVPASHWAKEVITRDGALNLVKGYGAAYRPEASVSKQEAIAFVMRSIGYEQQAVALGATLQTQQPGASTTDLWALGYMNYAMQMGLITPVQYANALAADQASLTETDFRKTADATREEVAFWIYAALNYADSTVFNPQKQMQAILTFRDWQSVNTQYAIAVENIAAANIMNGDNNKNFRPKSKITRAEMAQVLANMDSIYFKIMGIEKKTGTVGVIRDNQYETTNNADSWRNIYVRTNDGTMDLLQYEKMSNSSPQATDKDAVVYRAGGRVGGMRDLNEGDVIEYLVDTAAKTVLYVQVTSQVETSEVTGQLYQIDVDAGTVNIKGSNGAQYIFSMIDGLLTNNNSVNYILMDDKLYDVTKMPYGSRVKLKLIGNIVKQISFVGESVLVAETRGIVVENNPEYGYITIIDNNGNRITKNYYENDLVVEKQQHYDTMDEIGYIDQMFPNFKYDPRDAAISDIEAGDIVFIRPSADDFDAIESISAATNYIMKYGKIKQLRVNDNYIELLMEYENGQTAWFDVAKDIFISKQGKPISSSGIQAGDWAKILVNEAIIEPGYVIDSVKEMTIEGDAHYISSLVKGNLSGINAVQGQLLVQGAETLAKTGWSDYKDLAQFSIAGKDVEYYYDGKRISLDYAVHYLSKSDAMVYIALENNYAGDQVRKVTFRINRDEVLSPDTVVYADGNGAFNLGSYVGNIGTDSGTIVRRYGRLVQGQDIMASDYITLVLNGAGKAAVIDIVDAPDTSAIMVARGRILSVTDNKSFKVQSMSTLSGTNWIYTPVQREFAIDNKTLFLNQAGLVDSSAFVSYTDASVADKVYNIITDGSRASYVIDSPYANRAVRGTIYQIDGNTVSLKDAYVQDAKNGKWSAVSNTNNTIVVTLQSNTIIGKSNVIVQPSGLVVGDQLKVMTDSVPATPTAGMGINGYIIMVEK